MSRRTKPSAPPPDKTIAWFEQAIVEHTPKQGLLDATSLGIWTINEQAGITAGEWKRHRILMQDLDVDLLTNALGELLGAIVQTAHAVDVSLETIMARQVERVQAAPARPSRRREPAPQKPTISHDAVVAAPARAKRRDALVSPAASLVVAPPPETSPAVVARRKRAPKIEAVVPIEPPKPATPLVTTSPEQPKRGRPPKARADVPQPEVMVPQKSQKAPVAQPLPMMDHHPEPKQKTKRARAAVAS